MERHLNLVESDFERLEKRVLPRFPFCFLTFKCSEENSHVFEVKDISYSGMQLCLKLGTHNMKVGETINGNLHWGDKQIEVNAMVKWTTELRVGVEFFSQEDSKEKINNFLEMKHLANMLKPVHHLDYGVDIPVSLKYWLRADGPVELFVWQHSHGELSCFQILIMDGFVEWQDGEGLKTARVISKRDIDTPLINEDEFVFKIDNGLDLAKIDLASDLIDKIEARHLSSEVLDFIKIKLRS